MCVCMCVCVCVCTRVKVVHMSSFHIDLSIYLSTFLFIKPSKDQSIRGPVNECEFCLLESLFTVATFSRKSIVMVPFMSQETVIPNFFSERCT